MWSQHSKRSRDRNSGYHENAASQKTGRPEAAGMQENADVSQHPAWSLPTPCLKLAAWWMKRREWQEDPRPLEGTLSAVGSVCARDLVTEM